MTAAEARAAELLATHVGQRHALWTYLRDALAGGDVRAQPCNFTPYVRWLGGELEELLREVDADIVTRADDPCGDGGPTLDAIDALLDAIAEERRLWDRTQVAAAAAARRNQSPLLAAIATGLDRCDRRPATVAVSHLLEREGRQAPGHEGDER